MSRLPRGIRQLKKPPANEATEPLALTALRGKAIVQQSRFSRTRHGPVANNIGQNRRKAMCNKTK